MVAVLAPQAVPQPAVRRRVRAVIAWLHLWVGLGVGAVFAVAGLSGSLLVFGEELLRWQHPQIAAFEPHVDGDVLTGILSRESALGLRGVHLPHVDRPVWTGFYVDGRERLFAPDDGRLLLERTTDNDALVWLFELHAHLLGGEAGEQVLGVVGWISLGLLLSGLYLWWPKRGRMRAQLRVYRGPPVRRWLTWHRSAGVVLLPLLLLSTLTGVGMIYHDGARTLLTTVFGGEDTPVPPTRDARRTDVDWPAVLARAQAALPGARLTRTGLPAPDSDVVSFRAQAIGEWHPNGRSTVHVDRAGRELLLVHDATSQRLGARMTEAIYPLHIGAVGGLTMKWLTVLAGLMPAFLLVTGFLYWRRRRGR